MSNIFSNNPNLGQNTYLIELIIMGVLMVIYIVFAIYYYNLDVNLIITKKNINNNNKNKINNNN
jgi:hypothetical protein